MLAQIGAVYPIEHGVVSIGIGVMHPWLVTGRRRHPTGPGGDGASGVAGAFGTEGGQVGAQSCGLDGVYLGLNLARQRGQHDNAEHPVHVQLLPRQYLLSVDGVDRQSKGAKRQKIARL